MRLNGMMAGGSPPGDGGEDNIFSRDLAPPSGDRRLRQALVLGVVLLLLGTVWLYLQGGENRALNAMSPAQRAAFYKETWDEVRLVCLTDAGVKRGFEKRCQQHADFLTQFPECDEACRRELAPVLRRAVR